MPRNITWTLEEVRAIIPIYFEMLQLDMQGKRFSKMDYYRKSLQYLNGRNEGAAENKCQNISAVLITHGFGTIKGLPPRSNKQGMLENEVLSYLNQYPELVERLRQVPLRFCNTPPFPELFFDLSSDPVSGPSHSPKENEMQEDEPNKQNRPRIVNWAEKQTRDKELGDAGEYFVVKLERNRLRLANCHQLAEKVVWASKDQGDGLGYDILSYETDGTERYIEVKTTSRGQNEPFHVTESERRFAASNAQRFYLYRVFDFGPAPKDTSKNANSICHPKHYIRQGAFEDHFNLQPRQYLAIP